jgi:transcriptional regulator with XRE-family HTH domain
MDDFAARLRGLMAERGLSGRALARQMPCDPALISRFINARQQPSAEMAARLDEVLETGGELAGLLDRRGVLKLGLAVTLTPQALRVALAEAAGEAVEFTQAASATAVGAGTFAHLGAVVAELDQSYPRQAPGGLFPVARTYRAQVQRLISGPCTLAQKRDLYVYAAWFSELLAWLSHDLGAPLAAHAWAADCFEHARQAGHGELCGWAADAMASIALYARQPAHAVETALAGLAHVPAGHPLTVRLRTQAARGHARLGQRDACETLIADAEQEYSRLPAQQSVRAGDGGLLAAFAVTAYPTSCYVWLGDFIKAATYGRRALEIYESASADERSPSREAIARVDLALALAGQGQPGEAAELGCQALGSPRLTGSVLSRARDLDAALAARYPGQEDAARFHARCQTATSGHRQISA